MSSTVSSTIDAIVSDVIAKHAIEVDTRGAFPNEAVEALGRARLLGLISAESVGGLGQGLRAAALVVERIARVCPSTAMVTCMHFAGAAVIEKLGSDSVRRAIAAGDHLSTLAFSEAGSRSQFWAPVSTATRVAGGIALTAHKSWATSSRHATAYVWSSKPLDAKGASTLWLVPRMTPGLRWGGDFDGLGLRGNDSGPIIAEGAIIPEANRLGEDGAGLSVMLDIALPYFNVMNAACSVGLMDSAVDKTVAHVSTTGFSHDGSKLRDLPTIRANLARMKISVDASRALLMDTLDAMEQGRPDAMLRVLQCKAAAGESSIQVLDLAMRTCGGAAFRKEVGVERAFRDARAASVMAPTTDALYDFIGKAISGMPVF